MKQIIISLLLLLSINVTGQNKIKIDSVGVRRGQSIEVFSGDSCYLYRWRGLGKPKVRAGMIATIHPPTKRHKRYFLTLNTFL